MFHSLVHVSHSCPCLWCGWMTCNKNGIGVVPVIYVAISRSLMSHGESLSSREYMKVFVSGCVSDKQDCLCNSIVNHGVVLQSGWNQIHRNYFRRLVTQSQSVHQHKPDDKTVGVFIWWISEGYESAERHKKPWVYTMAHVRIRNPHRNVKQFTVRQNDNM